MKIHLILLLILALVPATTARALSDFYFTTTSSGGMVTGQIIGLQNSGTSTPSEIIILSQPSGFTYGPSSLLANGFSFYGSDNTFTVSGGNIVGANVGIFKMISPSDFQGYGFNVSELSFTGANGVYQTVGGVEKASLNTAGFPGTTYTRFTPVPEPKTEALIFALAGLGLLVLRKFRPGQRSPAASPV